MSCVQCGEYHLDCKCEVKVSKRDELAEKYYPDNNEKREACIVGWNLCEKEMTNTGVYRRLRDMIDNRDALIEKYRLALEKIEVETRGYLSAPMSITEMLTIRNRVTEALLEGAGHEHQK